MYAMRKWAFVLKKAIGKALLSAGDLLTASLFADAAQWSRSD